MVSFADGMLPTPTELTEFNGVLDIVHWAGLELADSVETGAWAGLCKALGTPNLLRQVVAIPKSSWDSLLGESGCKVLIEAASDGQQHPPTVVELA